MVDIVFPPSTAPGHSPAESGGRLYNSFGEKLIGVPVAQYVLRRTSGLRQFSDTLQNQPFRSSFYDGGGLLYYSGWNGQIVKTTSGGVSSIVTALSGTDWITWAINQKTPTPDRVLVCDFSPFSFDSTSKTAWPTPAAPNSVCFGEGYFFITIADGRVYASDLNSLNFNTLNRIQAQSLHNDGLVRCVWYAGELYIFSKNHCEVWGSGGNPNATGFPLRRTTVIPRGLAARSLVTGWEDSFGGKLCFVADDNTVRAFNGYVPEVISDPWLTTVLEAVTDKSTLSMGCFVKRGHQCIYIRGPGFCVCYDFSTNWWHERLSYLSPTWRLHGGASAAFGEWLSGDANSGKLGAIDFNTYTEFGQPLRWQVESGPVQGFPVRFQVARAAFQFQQGTGLADTGAPQSDVDPQLEISWSDDNGASWSNPILRPIGRIGQYNNMMDPRMLGMTGYVGRRWRLACSSAVYVALLGGGCFQEQRA